MNWLQYFCVDIIGFFAVLTLLGFYAVVVAGSSLGNRLAGKPGKAKKQKLL